MLQQSALTLSQMKTNSQFWYQLVVYDQLLPFVLVSIFSSPALFATMFLPFEGFLEVTEKERITFKPWPTTVFDVVSKECQPFYK